jgi:hypothetical protein
VTDLAMDDKQWLDSYLADHGTDTWSDSGEWSGRVDNGRHAFNEDAVLTPIFHALTSGGWRDRQRENGPATRRSSDPVDAFEADPLGAPIPQQAYGSVPEQPLRRSSSRLRSVTTGDDAGRHRRRRESQYY